MHYMIIQWVYVLAGSMSDILQLRHIVCGVRGFVLCAQPRHTVSDIHSPAPHTLHKQTDCASQSGSHLQCECSQLHTIACNIVQTISTVTCETYSMVCYT